MNTTPSSKQSYTPFPGNMARRLIDIQDGTSNTVFVLESSGRSMRRCMMKNCSQDGYTHATGAWASSTNRVNAQGSLFDGNVDANSSGPCTMNCTNTTNSSGGSNIYSWHTGGTNMLFGDGSVRFVSETIPWTILAKMMTSGNGELITGDY